MNSKRLVEIFEMIKENLINGETYVQNGICGNIAELFGNNKMTFTERDYIRNYLFSNKPKLNNIYSDFFKNEYWIDDAYWWEKISLNHKTKQIRIDYLTKLIANIK